MRSRGFYEANFDTFQWNYNACPYKKNVTACIFVGFFPEATIGSKK